MLAKPTVITPCTSLPTSGHPSHPKYAHIHHHSLSRGIVCICLNIRIFFVLLAFQAAVSKPHTHAP
ncbi:hypothetical protein M431DRAFT_512276 [Trichoderma harzianum CBS 226.95]|uniref:Uncharacterized protein n=1 Tax=Trichoderma harzianum CBS 226.95 TaxID=983964 RepID=A0A2T3ZZ76_TRIHA|nr:hypothetical protein M431DRAFT_512276 [Trichoderma harzianum CBS 226.95]PTB50043.1 hypothetical protein M431DRAFT_512276 [Trichoderma harzianum CBS 226.95]